MKLPSSLRRVIAVAGLLLLGPCCLTSCVNRFESVHNYVVHHGATNSYYSQDATVLRDRKTGQLWRVNRNYPQGCIWEPIGWVSSYCPPAGSGSK